MTLFQCISYFFSILFLTTACAQNMENVTIKTHKLSDKIYMLTGRGGNIGISVGQDGVFIIDDQFAPLTNKIVNAINAISNQPLQFLVNTHWHGDHTGGNENMAKLDVKIIAHDNVRKRLDEKPELPEAALPIITFNDEMSVYMNGEQVAISHIEHAHTDGDAILYFTKSNVLHTGDTYFKERFPYIDLNSGGSVHGYIKAVKKGLSLCDDHTKIIPGHGSLSNKEEYKVFLIMLETIKNNIEAEIKKGKTEDEIVNNNTLTKYYDDLGYGSGFINSKKMRRTFYLSLKQ